MATTASIQTKLLQIKLKILKEEIAGMNTERICTTEVLPFPIQTVPPQPKTRLPIQQSELPIQSPCQPMQQALLPSVQQPKSMDMNQVLQNITLQNFQLQQMLLQNTLLSQVQKQQEVVHQEPVKVNSSAKRKFATECTQTNEIMCNQHQYAPSEPSFPQQYSHSEPSYRPASPQPQLYSPYGATYRQFSTQPQQCFPFDHTYRPTLSQPLQNSPHESQNRPFLLQTQHVPSLPQQHFHNEAIYRPSLPQTQLYSPYDPPKKRRSLAYKRFKKVIFAVLFASILSRRLNSCRIVNFKPSLSTLSKCDTALVPVYKANLALHSALTEIAQMTRQGGYFTSDSILSDLASVFSKSWIPTLRKVLFHLVSAIEQLGWDDVKRIRVLYETCKCIAKGDVAYTTFAESTNDPVRASLLYCIVLRPLVVRMLCNPVECGLVTACSEALGRNLRTISAYLIWIICKAVGGNTGSFIEFDRAAMKLVPGDVGGDLFDKNGMKGLKSLPKGVVEDAIQRLVSWASIFRQEIELSYFYLSIVWTV